jgi:hypothetical protein
MAKFDDKINNLLNEFTSSGMAGMMNMASDDLAPAKGWKYVHDEEEETGKYDDGDGKKERCDFVPCGKKGKKKEEDEEHHEVEARKRLKKDKGMGAGTKKQAEKEIKKRDVSAKMKRRMKDDE